MSETASADAAAVALIAAYDARARRIETPCGEGMMTWRVWGEGEPLVVAHGAHGNWTHWIRNIDRLSATRMLVAVDLPGHGDSALPVTQDHPGIAAAIAEGLRAIFGDRPVDLVGFSLGGCVFTHVAAWYPELVRRLVLVGTGGLDTPHGAVRIGRISGLRGEARQAQLKANLLGLMLHHPDSADDLAQYMLVANAHATRFGSVIGMVMPDRVVRILPEVRAPIDAIWGAFDRPHPDPEVQAAVIRRTHPECRLRVVAGGGHWVMYERPEGFDAALLDLLRQPVPPG
jgi:pimeloyl-ACP methyl ester carboxylesterase